MKIMIACLIAAMAGVFISSQESAAQGFVSAKVLNVRIDSTGLGMIIFSQAISNPASCADTNHYPSNLSFNMATPGGRGIAAMALAAQITGQVLVVYGSDGCGNYGGLVEDWSWGYIQQ